MENRRSNTSRLWKAAGLLLALGAVTGCALVSTATFYGGMYRAHRDGVRFRRTYEHLHSDVPFSDRSDVTLALYAQPDGSGYPVLIFVHGGGWNSYDKELFTPVAKQLLPQGMVVVIPDYTLYPDATYQQMAREVADATAWVLGNIEAYGGDPQRVYLSGHSAGAHLSGVYDIARHAALGGPRAWLIHGDADETVPLAESERMSTALRAAGVEAELIVYPGAGHSDFLLGALRDDQAPVIVEMGRIVGR